MLAQHMAGHRYIFLVVNASSINCYVVILRLDIFKTQLMDPINSFGNEFIVGPMQVWIACTFGQQHILKWLLANGADPTIADHNGHTPLYQV